MSVNPVNIKAEPNLKFKKILLAAFLGSITMFVWGTISHMVLITGIGYKPLPNESAIMQSLNDTILEKGLYFFPGKDFKNTTHDEEKQWLNKYETGPRRTFDLQTHWRKSIFSKKISCSIFGLFIIFFSVIINSCK